MQYIGGKYRIAKELASAISMFRPRVYWEPFVGAGNVIQYVDAPVKFGSDLDLHIVSYLECVRDGWLPPANVSETDYSFYKTFQPITRECYALKAAVGYGCSFGGRFFEGFARDERKTRSFAETVREDAKKQSPRLSGIVFRQQCYSQGIPDGCDLIYCDPPYANTKKVGAKHPFDSRLFWEWCRSVALQGITVLVTEFCAPPFAHEIWAREKATALKRKDGSNVMTERLFLVRPEDAK